MVTVRVWDQARAGIRVRLRGGGVNRVVTTNASGVVRAVVNPVRAGTLRISGLRTLVMDGCSTSRRIAPAPRVRGAAGGGGGGVALTGRPVR
jgi:hypothetical protein